MIDQIANEIIIGSMLLKTNNVSRIAEEIGYRPILIITALYRGDDQGKFKYVKKTDTIAIDKDVEVEQLAVTDGMSELIDMLEQFMSYMNRDETDLTFDELMMLLGGTPKLHIEIATYVSKRLTTYDLVDPKDKKSNYTFVTLKENASKLWGQKQFNPKKSKAKKFADQAKKG